MSRLVLSNLGALRGVAAAEAKCNEAPERRRLVRRTMIAKILSEWWDNYQREYSSATSNLKRVSYSNSFLKTQGEDAFLYVQIALDCVYLPKSQQRLPAIRKRVTEFPLEWSIALNFSMSGFR